MLLFTLATVWSFHLSNYFCFYFCRRRNELSKDDAIWFDDNEMNDFFDNKTFGFRVFTNPGELHEHFEKQMEEMLKMFDDGSVMNESGIHSEDENLFKLKPGLKRHIEEFHKSFNKAEVRDRDLDDK